MNLSAQGLVLGAEEVVMPNTAIVWTDAKYNSAAFKDGLWLNAALCRTGEYEASCHAEDDDRVLGGVICATLEAAKLQAEALYAELVRVEPVPVTIWLGEP